MPIDFRRPIREANAAFAAEPSQLAMALVLARLLLLLPFQWIRAIATHPGGWREFLLAIVLTPLYGVAEIVTVARFLAMREGRRPGSVRSRLVLKYRGLARLLGSYWIRLVGWFVVATLFTGILFLGWRILLALLHAGHGHLRPQGWTIWAGGQAIFLVWWLLMSRYLLAAPFLAIAQGSDLNLVRESARRSKGFRGSLAALAAVEFFASGALLAAVVHILLPTSPGWHPLFLLATLAVNLIGSLVRTWFLLVRTGLALQVFEGVPPPQPTELAVS